MPPPAYGAKGDDIVAMNHAAIERGFTDAREVPIPAHWATQRGDFVSFYATGRDPELVEYVNRIRSLPTCKRAMTSPFLPFLGREDGHLPLGTSQYESAASRGSPHLAAGKLHPVQSLLTGLPPRRHPSVAMTEAEAEKAPPACPPCP